jgi:hypothetical protein
MIHSLTQYIFLALGLMASLWLFFTLKCEIQAHARKQRKRLEEMDRKVTDANERHPDMVIIPTAPRAGFNLSRRVQAMRMLRQGEDISHVAAALGIPRREVELLIRVQAIVRASIASI